jgi:hypothetical protein
VRGTARWRGVDEGGEAVEQAGKAELEEGVEVATVPLWLHGFARNQPCTPIIEMIRSTLAGHPDGGSAVRTAARCLGLLAVGVAGSVAAFRRRTT